MLGSSASRIVRATRQPPRQSIRIDLAVVLKSGFRPDALTNENGVVQAKLERV